MKLFGNSSGKHRAARNKAIRDIDIPEDEYLEDDGEYIEDSDHIEDSDEFEEDEPEYEDEEPEYSTGHSRKKRRLTGTQRGLIILFAALVFLAALVVILWKSFTALPDFTTTPPSPAVTPSQVVQTTETPEPSASMEVEVVTSEEPEVKVSAITITPIESSDDVYIDELLNIPGDRKEGVYTVLLIGTDKSEFLTDTLMLCRFNIKTHELNIVSIPRDTFINLKDAMYKMNSAFTAGYNKSKSMEDGINSLMDQVGLLVGFRPDFYCMINLESFVEIIDIIGGIDFDVPQDMVYDDPMQDLHINLSKGYQHLDGNQCMQLVRYRSGYASADIQRMSVQQDFIKAVADKMLSIGTVKKIPELAQTVFDNLYTNMTLGNICGFAEQLLKVDVDEITTTTFVGEPGAWKAGTSQFISFYFLYGYDTLDIVNEYLNPYEEDLTIDDIYVYTVENAEMTRSLRSTSTNNHAYSN